MSDKPEYKASDALERLQTVFDVINTPAGEDLRKIFEGVNSLHKALYEEDVPRTPMLAQAVTDLGEAMIDAIMSEIARVRDDKGEVVIGVLQDVLRRE